MEKNEWSMPFMSRLSETVKFIENIPRKNIDLLKEICSQLKKIIKENRPIMYSDIINIIIRKQFYGESYNQLIVWCNYHIRKG
ncbi:MAG: hypothetical protein MUP85_16385, partial [Candidatus Lokiarchaeota archaeon]|nr:hypothetical protein [Candidatus Lokiarchaeota archaeon]